jgi:biopolymer transport protein ExbD
MAQIEDNGSGGRKVNVDVNIVPFIDLMSVLIIFLLITAVWSQVSMIQLGSSIYGKNTGQNSAEPPPRAEIPFRLDVLNSGYRVVVGQQSLNIPKVAGEYDKGKLLIELKRVKEIYPEKSDAVVTMGDEQPYKNLIGGMDMLLEAGFPQISIATGGVK